MAKRRRRVVLGIRLINRARKALNDGDCATAERVARIATKAYRSTTGIQRREFPERMLNHLRADVEACQRERRR